MKNSLLNFIAIVIAQGLIGFAIGTYSSTLKKVVLPVPLILGLVCLSCAVVSSSALFFVLATALCGGWAILHMVGVGHKYTLQAPERLALIQFMQQLSETQQSAVFGVCKEGTTNTVQAGVLSREQGFIIWDIAFNEGNVGELKKLRPGGKIALTIKQKVELETACGLSEEQVKLLKDVLEK